MAFNSFSFVIFFLVFFALWPLLKKGNHSRWFFLTLASFIFYAWWDWRFLFLIIFSGLIDYIAGIAMSRKPQYRKIWLIFSLIGNLGSLILFKYSYFLSYNLDKLLNHFGLHADIHSHIPEFFLLLPVGISFYTFQSMSYTIDIYRGRLSYVKNIFHFFAYLSMFPQLVAGPIIRAKDLLTQLSSDRKTTKIQLWHGFRLVITGFFQKTVLADHIAVMVNHYFNADTPDTGAFNWWIATVGFAFQIYFDFSGYSLIARGLAKMMGYHFKMNFNHPYLASTLKNFWQRWHISLSSWFRDYVYFALGGNRHGKYLSLFYMTVTMLLSGLWHGAAFTFIIWGFIHAIALGTERFNPLFKTTSIRFIRYCITMFIVVIAWVYFRAGTVDKADHILSLMFSAKTSIIPFKQFFSSYLFLGISFLIEILYFIKSKNKLLHSFANNNTVMVSQLFIMILMVLFLRGPEQVFIYFQF